MRPTRRGDEEEAGGTVEVVPAPDSARRTVDRDILRLAVPSLGALIAEPLFLMTDSAFIARVSTVSLAGRSEEHTAELQSRGHLLCRLLLGKKRPRTDA